MKIEKPVNGNYCATVVKIANIIPLDGCDNVVATNIFGFQAIVSKDTKIGDIGIVFPAETQLSDEYCYENNLYRHADKNKVESSKGYIEDNRRVKAVKFRGHSSSCLFVSLDSLAFAKIDKSLLSVGDEFDNLNGKEICRKYEVFRRSARGGTVAAEKKFSRVDSKHMPEHFETSQFYKWGHEIPDEKEVVITRKLLSRRSCTEQVSVLDILLLSVSLTLSRTFSASLVYKFFLIHMTMSLGLVRLLRT